MNAETAGHVGTPQLKQFLMVNIKMGGLKGERVRPQSIRPLIKFPRGILDQVISLRTHDGGCERAPGPGLMLPDSKMVKQRATSSTSRDQERQATSIKLQATSAKLQAPSLLNNKRQASSSKLQAPWNLNPSLTSSCIYLPSKSFMVPGPRAWTRIKEFFGCLS